MRVILRYSCGSCVLAALLLTSLPARADAQVHTAPVQHLRNLAEIQFLGGASESGGFASNLRVTVQRRQTLRQSVILSGLLLQDGLSRSAGGALGGSLAFPLGTLVMEPFAEIGAVTTDARIAAGSYQIVGSDGTPVTVQRYRAVQGPAGVGGAGASLSTSMGERTSARFTLGYWHVAGSDGLSRGGLRLGVSLGAGRRDVRWSALASDRTAPVTRFLGRHTEESDSVEVGPDGLLVVAADANGIERILVGFEQAEFTRADRGTAERVGLEGAVAARIPINPPFGGQVLEVVVRDSAGITSRRHVRAFPAPDREAPLLEHLRSSDDAARRWTVELLAHDASGIADASVGFCPLQVGPSTPLARERDDLPATSRLVMGWGDFSPTSTVRVRDRSGNVREIGFDPWSPEVGNEATAPDLRVAAEGRPADRGRRSVRVRGTASDPAGGWIRRVTADGHPLSLRMTTGPTQVTFEGWLELPESTTSLDVVVATMDGRVARQSLSVSDLDTPQDSRLHVLVVIPGPEEHEPAHVRRLVALASRNDATVLTGKAATREEIVRVLLGMQNRVRPSDAILIRFEGHLAANPGASEPSWVVEGGEVPWGQLSRQIRALPSAVTLVSADIRTGHTWQAALGASPGAPAGAGCFETEDRAGTVLDLHAISMEALLESLEGAADRNADGRVTAGELRTQLGLDQEAVSVFDPQAVVVGGGR